MENNKTTSPSKGLHWDEKEFPEQPPVQRNELLEALSDLVRKGEPIGFFEAVAVADYQTRLQKEREAKKAKTLWGRLKAFFKRSKKS